MKGFQKERRVFQLLRPLLGWYPWAVPAIIGLGILSSLAEGLGVSLFVPFLQSFNSPNAGAGASAGLGSGNQLVEALGHLFARIPASQRLGVVAASIFGSILLKAILSYGHTLLWSWLDARIGHRMRSGIFDRLLWVSYRFLEKDQTGKLFNTLTTESWRAGSALSTLVSLVITLCTLCVYLVLLLLISWQLTLLVGVVMVAISLSVKLLTRRADALGRQATAANAQLAERMVEGLWGMKVIRTFSRERAEQERFNAISDEVGTTFMKLSLLGAAVNPVYEVLTAALLVFILLSTLRTPADLPVVLVFILVLYRLQPRIKAVDEARLHLVSLSSAVEEVTSLLQSDNKPFLSSGTIPFEGLREGITFCNVGFSYDVEEQPALREVSFQIKAGQTTALVGPSGAGKSTIIDLLLRFYDPTQGEILLDGERLRETELSSWRRRVALVSQDVFLFNTTMGQNIAYGRPDATMDEIIAAAKQADAHDFISQMPQGYDTPVGDHGVRLSGGQKQRLTLARAIVCDPEVLILDEATNALDSISEHEIQKAIDRLSGTRTIILIAHRLATIERADHIIVLESGRVREQGEFEELARGDGLFARLYHLQNRRALSATLPNANLLGSDTFEAPVILPSIPALEAALPN